MAEKQLTFDSNPEERRPHEPEVMWCGWCLDMPATFVVFTTPTCTACAVSREARIMRAQQRWGRGPERK